MQSISFHRSTFSLHAASNQMRMGAHVNFLKINNRNLLFYVVSMEDETRSAYFDASHQPYNES